MERDLLSMKQQLAEKEKQVQELQMKLQTKQEKEHIHILPTESVDELNKKLETQYAISRRKTMEIEDLKATMRQKDEKMIDTEKELASLKELSETRLQEIEQLKLKLENNNRLQVPVEETSETIKDESSDDDTSSIENIVMKPEDKSLTVNLQENGEVEWSQDGVQLTSPSVDQCKEVISKLEEEHKSIIFNYSSSDSIQVLIPTVLERGTINQLAIYFSLLSLDDVLSFSSQLSINKSLTTLRLTHGSMSDDGVIALAQSLQYNKTLHSLYLEYNPGITSACAQSLAELLLTNNTLNGLSLDHTNIDTDGVMILMESLKTNNTLMIFRLDKQHKETCSTLPYYKHIKNRLHFVKL
ncbi:PREDICTED: leiomodin-3-like [Amphimedon queenslandica]|uniref:Uncharacterized protein n=2 Tax=Amphimedon queenslandica TaxID=400682 RepID=A0AAN0JD93_AMPQE|nr:PREDICTED: leiomodin-3-like [Amphimedon queenslandica]|eukprot:XP_019854995.1 PREDICTED: leiomodin-3-like [Amphimedon queenslandica]